MTQYKIHGKERREMAHYLHRLKFSQKMFWHYRQVEKDMGYELMTDEEADKLFKEREQEVKQMEELLKEM